MVSNSLKVLGLKGIYFEPGTLFINGFKEKYYDKIFNRFWKKINALSIPIYMETDLKDYYEQMNGLFKILEKYPSIDPSWLLTGKGNMISNNKEGRNTNEKEPVPVSGIFDSNEEPTVINKNQEKGTEHKVVDISKQMSIVTNVKDVKSVILLYSDGTFFQYIKMNDE